MGIVLDNSKVVYILLTTSGCLLLIAGATLPEGARNILRTFGIVLLAFLLPVAMFLVGFDLVTA